MKHLQLFRAETEFQETTSLSLISKDYWHSAIIDQQVPETLAFTHTLIQLIIFSSLLPQTRSCPANFFLKICFCRGCYFSSSPFKVKYLLEVPTVQWSSADPKLDKVKLYSLILPRRNLNFSQPLKNSFKSPSLLLTPNLKTRKVVYQPWLFGQMFVSIMTLAAI